MTAYRDGVDARRSLLERLVDELRAIEQRVAIPDALDAAYGPRTPPNVAWCETRDRVMTAHEARETLAAAALDAAVSDAEAVLGQWRLLATDAGELERAMVTPPRDAPPPVGAVSSLARVVTSANGVDQLVIDEGLAMPALVEERLLEQRCEAVQVAWAPEAAPHAFRAPWVLQAAARREEAPFTLRLELWHQMGALLARTTVTTSVPRARRPLLVLTRGAWWKRLVADRRALGSETRTGDADFDESFVVRGSGFEPSAAMRAHLQTLLRCKGPAVSVRDGVASVEWEYDPEAAVLAATFAILDELRNAPLAFSLRRKIEPSDDDDAQRS